MLRRTAGLFLALLCLLGTDKRATPLHAQPYERTVRDTVALTPGSVSVENEEGRIAVSTWDRNAVAYEARLVSRQAADYVEDTVIDVGLFSKYLSLESTFDDLEAQWTFGPELFGYGVSHPAVHYTLTVPRAAEVAIEGEDAEVEVTGLRALLQVETDDGNVRVANQRGGLTIDTHEGQAEVGIDSLAAVAVDTHEGRVALTVPRDAGFTLATDLGEDATVQSDFVLDPLRNDDDNYEGSLRGGGPLVRLSSHEGTIVLRSP
jgi:hypothetical protein